MVRVKRLKRMPPMPAIIRQSSAEEGPFASESLGWLQSATTIREGDEAKIKGLKEDIDTLLVFGGLFSAVITAFLIESYKTLSPDPAEVSLQVLLHISLQLSNFTANGSRSSEIVPNFLSPSGFTPSRGSIMTNAAWFSSLTISLMAASYGMLVKQWLREFLAVDYPSPLERLRVRCFRYPALSQWKVFEIVGVLPLLLQLALGLFFLGLCFFASSIHPTIQRTIIPLVVLWATLLFAATLAPLFSSRCPYKATFLKSVMKSLRQSFFSLQYSSAIIARLGVRFSRFNIRRQGSSSMTVNPASQQQYLSPYLEEDTIAKSEIIDLDVLAEIDSVKANDELITIVLPDLVSRHRFYGEALTAFVFRILRNRGLVLGDFRYGSHPLDLQHLSKSLWDTITTVLANGVYFEFEKRSLLVDTPFTVEWDGWIQDVLLILFSTSNFPLEPLASHQITNCFSFLDSTSISMLLDIMRTRHSWTGEYISTFVLQVICHLDSEKDIYKDWYPPDLYHLPQQLWNDITWILVDALCDYRQRHMEAHANSLSISSAWDEWMKNTFRVIFGNSDHPIPDGAAEKLYEMFSVDEIIDRLLSSVTPPQASSDGQEVTSYILRILSYRAGSSGRAEYPLDLSYLSLRTHSTITYLLALALGGETIQGEPWTLDAIHIIFSISQHQLPEQALRAVTYCFHSNPSDFWKGLQSRLTFRRRLTYADQVSFHLRLLGNIDPHRSDHWRLEPLSESIWNTMAIALVNDLSEEVHGITSTNLSLSLAWIKAAIHILFSDIQYPLPLAAINSFNDLAANHAETIVSALVGTYEEETTTLLGLTSVPFSFTRMLQVTSTFVHRGTKQIVFSMWKLQGTPRIIDLTFPVLARHAAINRQSMIEAFLAVPFAYRTNRMILDRLIKFYIQRCLVQPDIMKRLDQLQPLIMDETTSALAITLIVTNIARIRGVYWPLSLQIRIRRSLQDFIQAPLQVEPEPWLPVVMYSDLAQFITLGFPHRSASDAQARVQRLEDGIRRLHTKMHSTDQSGATSLTLLRTFMNHPDRLSQVEAERVLIQFSTTIIQSPLWTLEHCVLDENTPDITIVSFALRVINHQLTLQGAALPVFRPHRTHINLSLSQLEKHVWEDVTAAMADFLDRVLYNWQPSTWDRERTLQDVITNAVMILLAVSPYEFGRKNVYLTISRPPFILLVNRLDVLSQVRERMWKNWSSRLQEAVRMGLLTWWNLHELQNMNDWQMISGCEDDPVYRDISLSIPSNPHELEKYLRLSADLGYPAHDEDDGSWFLEDHTGN
ncbi:hypothetical protein QCA50_005314 [Cerrena zonata]|uniref:DUF6535 domain-containing protein n=1 Tax=Cerrena zonata TaxID=2478898 RepID=A0AAW0GL87_9APHY